MTSIREHSTPIWQGFDLEWRRTPHRLNTLASMVSGRVTDDASLECEHVARATVGRVPDTGRVRTWVTGIRSAALRFVDGEVGLDVGAPIGEPAEAEAPRVHVRAPLSLGRGWNADVVLRGFELACTTCPVGLHTRGMGLRLRSLRREVDGLSFVPGFFVHAANSPDPLTGGAGRYAYRMVAHYTVVFGPEDALCTGPDGDVEPSTRVRHDGRGSPPSLAPVEIRGRSGGPWDRAVLGVRGFRWRQHHAGRFGRDGRFVRQLHAYLEDQSYEATAGVARFRPRLWFSNRGSVTYAIDAEHELWTTLLQYRGDGPDFGRHVLEAPLPTGIGRGGEHLGRCLLR